MPTMTEPGIRTRLIRLDPRQLRLLDTNARFMRHETFTRLVENIRNDGCLTQIPFAWLDPADGRYLVLSGNHRVLAAIDAGLDEIDCQVTDDELPRARRVAIQLSHNAISGEDDPALLKQLYEELQELDLLVYSGLDDKMLDLLEKVEIDSLGRALTARHPRKGATEADPRAPSTWPGPGQS
ncbi:MAG: ParB N-terminal domain-containing protein [Acidimicrobiales bacterium]